jgi:putative chitinase
MPVNAALSAGWFWSTNGLNAIADRGDLETLTRKVNGGMNGFANRVALYHSGLTVFA